MANTYMKRCSTSLITREMQVKTMRYYLIPIRIAIIKKANVAESIKNCKKKC